MGPLRPAEPPPPLAVVPRGPVPTAGSALPGWEALRPPQVE
ncbi:hypothetical protein [Hymenobacter terricola]|nr:hypothetical protein [Hymenobacter terricola]